MVSTRGQSKAAAAPRKASSRTTTKPPAKPTTRPKRATVLKKSTRKNVTKASEKDDVVEEEDTESEDSDWEQPSRRRVKRMKKSHKPTATKRKTHLDLGTMLTMPFDIQLEIFSWLSVRDLISLSRTNKEFRQALTHRGATRMWKLARETEGVPEPPPAMSEPQWAALLFDGSRCSECSAPGVQNIDFGIRRRVCVGCRKKNLVHTLKFRKEYTEYDEVLLEMIPYTHYGGWSHGWGSNGRFYWLEDIYEISKEWARLQDAIRWRKPGARQKAADFLQARKDLVKSIDDGVKRYKDWHRSMLAARAAESTNDYRNRRNEILKRFTDMGYSATDVNTIQYTDEVVQRRPLTDRIWKRIHPILENIIREKRKQRIVGERKRMFQDIFQAYVKTLPAQEWPYHPSASEVLEFPALRAIVNSEWDVDVTREDLEALVPLIPGGIIAMREATKKDLTEKVLAYHKKLREAEADTTTKNGKTKTKGKGKARATEPAEPTEATTPTDPLNLVTSVFACTRCQTANYSHGRTFAAAWFGWEGALRHCCDDGVRGIAFNRGVLEISERGSQIATQLVKEVGLDPQTALIEDMDKIGAKWFCKTCTYQPDMVYGWKATVAHAMSWNHSDTTIEPDFRRLTDYQLGGVQPTDAVQYSYRNRKWGCAHCQAHCLQRETKPNVKTHLNDSHQITSPDVKTDMVFFFSRRTFEPVDEHCHRPPQPVEAQPAEAEEV